MSIEALNWSLQQEAPDSGSKLVLLVLANLANPQDGRCWPGIEYLVEKTQLSRRTVIDKLDRLERAGIIASRIRPGEGGGRRSNVYELAMCKSRTLGQCADSAGQCAKSAPNTFTNTKPSLSRAKPKRATQIRHTELPDDWETVCREKRPDLDPDKVFEQFRNWALATGKTYKDWTAAWRNWVIREKRAYTNGKAPAKPKFNGSDARPGESWEDYVVRKTREEARA